MDFPLIAFMLQQYFWMMIVVIAFYGLGSLLFHWAHRVVAEDPLILFVLQTAAGIGISMVFLFIAGSLGLLNKVTIGALILSGLALSGFQLSARLVRYRSSISISAHRSDEISLAAILFCGVVGVLTVPYLLTPLQIPHEWDELMYHLPYAQSWANSGTLAVNEWLRYPLFPYNMGLLYAGALVFDNEVLTHLLHALTGVLTCLLTFGVAKRFFNLPVAIIATWLIFDATRWGWDRAYVDLALMYFWACAITCLLFRHQTGDQRFSLLAAFLLAISAGIKYQALIYMPVFLVLALCIERRPSAIIKSAIVFLVFGSYWYLKNALISGDPVHPMGAQVFGSWLWNSADLQAQMEDIERVSDLPEWYFFIGLGAIFYWRSMPKVTKWIFISAIGGAALWYFLAGYTRYLLPMYPILALLSADVIVRVAGTLKAAVPQARFSVLVKPVIKHTVLSVLLLIAVVISFRESGEVLDDVAPNEAVRHELLSTEFLGYALISELNQSLDGPLYQFGFEGEIYLLGNDVRGDVFGPGRYSDVYPLTGDADLLAEHLQLLGARYFLVNKQRRPFSEISWDPDMSDRFSVLLSSDNAVLYSIN